MKASRTKGISQERARQIMGENFIDSRQMAEALELIEVPEILGIKVPEAKLAALCKAQITELRDSITGLIIPDDDLESSLKQYKETHLLMDLSLLLHLQKIGKETQAAREARFKNWWGQEIVPAGEGRLFYLDRMSE